MLCDGNMFHTIHVVDGLGKNRAAKFTIPEYECRENLRRTSIYNYEFQILSKRTSMNHPNLLLVLTIRNKPW
uniref:Uncharacterized protein n=1 Tax=Brassica oleracea TaxID=3712 RepID=A0A3P6A8I4_BRAOL|nr:unnamed protein product [Brassica oleracea]